MVGIKIRLSLVLVAGSALLKNKAAERGLIDPPNRVGGVAIVTDRQLLIGFIHCGAMNRLTEFLGNPQMTLAAGLGNITMVNT